MKKQILSPDVFMYLWQILIVLIFCSFLLILIRYILKQFKNTDLNKKSINTKNVLTLLFTIFIISSCQKNESYEPYNDFENLKNEYSLIRYSPKAGQLFSILNYFYLFLVFFIALIRGHFF
jgi:hypothetical protein